MFCNFVCIQKVSELKKKLALYNEKLGPLSVPALTDKLDEVSVNSSQPLTSENSLDKVVEDHQPQTANKSVAPDTQDTTTTTPEPENGEKDSTHEIKPSKISHETNSEVSISNDETKVDLKAAVNDTSQDPTGCLSPDSYSKFKEFLNHTPDLNLPWQPMRSVSQCGCGMAFSYSRKKVKILADKLDYNYS